MEMLVRQNETMLYELNDGQLTMTDLYLAVPLVKWTDVDNDQALVLLEAVTLKAIRYLQGIKDGQSFQLLRFRGASKMRAEFGIPFLTFADCKVKTKFIIRPKPRTYGSDIVTVRLVMTCRLTMHIGEDQTEATEAA